MGIVLKIVKVDLSGRNEISKQEAVIVGLFILAGEDVK